MNYLTGILKIDIVLIASAISSFLFALSDAVLMSAIASFSTMVLGCVGAYFAYKAKVFAERAIEQGKETHQAVNSRMEELLKIARQASRAEGRAEGVAEGKDDVSSADKVADKVVEKVVKVADKVVEKVADKVAEKVADEVRRAKPKAG